MYLLMIGYKVHVGTRLPHYYCRIVLQSAACCAALPFGTLSYKRHELGEDLSSIKCVFGFCCTVLCEIFLILKRI